MANRLYGMTLRGCKIYPKEYNSTMKPIKFLGDSLKILRKFPDEVKKEAGYQLEKVQCGEQPNDFKPLPSVGKGVEEIRIWEEGGTYRVIYTARVHKTVYVLHVFQKKTQATSKQALDIAKTRFAQLMRGEK